MEAINPYSFTPIDWHWMIWLAFFNTALPSGFYLAMSQWYSDSIVSVTENRRNVALIHASVWGPLFLLGLLSLGHDQGVQSASGSYIEHVSSNWNPLAYLASAWLLAESAMYSGTKADKWTFVVYSVLALTFHLI